MNYDDLGAIEYLRDYPHILEHIKFRSIDKSLEPFIEDPEAPKKDGGFLWRNTIEGTIFWIKILNEFSDEIDLNFWIKILNEFSDEIDLNYYNTVIDFNECELREFR